jgi:vacuolar protein sorting-associated protein 41
VNVSVSAIGVAVFAISRTAMTVRASCFVILDPKLPGNVYSRILSKMLDEVEHMRQSAKPDVTKTLVYEAEGHVLNTLLAWGTTRSLQEHIKFFEFQAKLDSSYTSLLLRTAESLHYRLQQSAVGYLDLTYVTSPASVLTEIPLAGSASTLKANDALFSIDDLFLEFARRPSLANAEFAEVSNLIAKLSIKQLESRLTIDAFAKLFLMKGGYDDALKCFLLIGAMHSIRTLEEIERDAIRFVNHEDLEIEEVVGPYSFVLYIIDFHHLHQCLLETNFLPGFAKNSPVCALIRLVGLKLVGDFLISNCTAPQPLSTTTSSLAATVKSGGERRGTLPIDLVAEQLKGTPKLFHWYLHLILRMKPELYVKFPTTANPPPIVAELHKKHLDCYLRFAGPNRDSALALSGVEAYLVLEKSTPLLSFLKQILPLGTISPIDVGKMLEIERRGGGGVSRIFALELAYIMENYGTLNESDARLILELFLIGCQSLMLAVSFAQRAKVHSSILWEKLIEHCLWRSKSEKLGDGSISGVYFGSLLEAAALSGADLAHLVARIPTGMQVEGLRPRLVAAVADYRLKVQLHAKANEMARDEVRMLRGESSRRLRHGVRFYSPTDQMASDHVGRTTNDDDNSTNVNIDEDLPTVLSSTHRPKTRPIRYSYSFAIPIR